jgi:hypothetical protein
MTGYTEIRYDEEKKRIVVEPLEMTQAFRNFRGGSSAWEQVGPGDDLKPEGVSLLEYIVVSHSLTNSSSGCQHRSRSHPRKRRRNKRASAFEMYISANERLYNNIFSSWRLHHHQPLVYPCALNVSETKQEHMHDSRQNHCRLRSWQCEPGLLSDSRCFHVMFNYAKQISHSAAQLGKRNSMHLPNIHNTH